MRAADAAPAAQAAPPLVLVLVGKCGVGKSSTANTLLGATRFTSRRSASSVTAACQSAVTLSAEGREVCVLDTPGLSSAEAEPKEIHAEMIRGLSEVSEAFGGEAEFVLLLVLGVAGRVDEDELRAFGSLGNVFGLRFYSHAVGVWTHGDLLRPSEGGMQGYLEGAGDAVLSFLGDIGGGSLTVNNSVELRAAGPEGWADQPPGCRQDLEALRRAADTAPQLCRATLAAVLAKAAEAGVAARWGEALGPPKVGGRKAARRERQRALAAARQPTAAGAAGGESYWSVGAWYRWAFAPEPEPEPAPEPGGAGGGGGGGYGQV